MAGKTKTMTQIRKIFQCRKNGWSIRKISKRTGISRNTIRTYLRRIRERGKDIDQVLELSDAQLSVLASREKSEEDQRIKELWDELPSIEKELSRVGVTRKVLWEEYRDKNPDGYGYSQFCDHLQRWRRAQQVVMHMVHEPGEILEVDYTGKKLNYVDQETGEVIDCDSLITVLPYSNMIFLEVVANQQQGHLVTALGHALEYYEGVPQAIKVDNMRSAVTKSDRYEPTFTQVMDEFAQHHQTTAITARVGKPRDKSNVENSVRIVYQAIYAKLRDRIFFSISEINEAVRPLLDKLNEKQMDGKEYSRKGIFEAHEKATLKTLPSSRFIVRKTAEYKVQKNYHIMLGEDRHFYSVPYRLVGQKVRVRYCFKLVEIYHQHLRVAAHERVHTKYEWTTIKEHMPANHQHIKDQRGWTAQDVEAKASKIGAYTLQVTQRILQRKIFVQQTFNSCLGLQSLGKKYGNDRLELACKRALCHGTTPTYKMIKNILNLGLDQAEIQNKINFKTPDHDNIRGSQIYQ